MNIISMLDVDGKLDTIFELATKLKKELKEGIVKESLKNKSLAMIFEKASTRTRTSFEVAMTQLGGHAIYLNWKDIQIDRGESLADTAMTLSRYVDGIMMRARRHEDLLELAGHSSVPVINGLTEFEHPCQAIADLFTIKEVKHTFKVKLAYIGDGNNVCNSLLLGCAIAGIDMAVATPKGYEPEPDILESARKRANSKIEVMNDKFEAVKGADIIYTDVWVSMGQEKEKDKRLRDFSNYTVDMELVRRANNPLVMHCLPAKRGHEITDEVMKSKNSIIFDQAENRLHTQKAILSMLLRGGKE